MFFVKVDGRSSKRSGPLEPKTFAQKLTSWGQPKFSELNTLLENAESRPLGDKLTVRCEVMYVSEITFHQSHSGSEIPGSIRLRHHRNLARAAQKPAHTTAPDSRSLKMAQLERFHSERKSRTRGPIGRKGLSCRLGTILAARSTIPEAMFVLE